MKIVSSSNQQITSSRIVLVEMIGKSKLKGKDK